MGKSERVKENKEEEKHLPPHYYKEKVGDSNLQSSSHFELDDQNLTYFVKKTINNNEGRERQDSHDEVRRLNT